MLWGRIFVPVSKLHFFHKTTGLFCPPKVLICHTIDLEREKCLKVPVDSIVYGYFLGQNIYSLTIMLQGSKSGHQPYYMTHSFPPGTSAATLPRSGPLLRAYSPAVPGAKPASGTPWVIIMFYQIKDISCWFNAIFGSFKKSKTLLLMKI